MAGKNRGLADGPAQPGKFARIFGDIANDHVRELTDINSREMLVLGVLAVAVMVMGLYPKPFTDVMHVSVDALLKHVAVGKLN